MSTKPGAREPRRYRYLFGPVPSRRFGRSLGVDLVPFKACSFNCVFCQLGRTPAPSLDRREYAPVADVLAELADWFAASGEADYITLAGSGEPTLHARFDDVLDGIRRCGRVPSLLLTNGSLFTEAAVRSGAAKADVVKLSLSAWDQASFEAVNRPHPSLRFDRIVEAYRAFRSEYRGALWIEVVLLPGFNAGDADVERIARLAESIRPDRVQLNTAVRPPAESGVTALAPERLERLASLFRPRAEVFAAVRAPSSGGALDEAAALDLLRRHPCSAEQIASAFGADPEAAARLLGELARAGRVRRAPRGGVEYYVPGEPE